jgi:hypothetical protein
MLPVCKGPNQKWKLPKEKIPYFSNIPSISYSLLIRNYYMPILTYMAETWKEIKVAISRLTAEVADAKQTENKKGQNKK